jgi:caffeoyl-CoA O-methyltransferase
MADPLSRKGFRYGTEEVRRFVDDLHAPHDRALAGAFAAAEIDGVPAIQVGAAEGRLIGLLARLAGAKRGIEIGTLAGYSAIRLARGMGEGAILWTLENDPRHAAIAARNLEAAGLAASVRIVEGDAVSTLPTLEPHGPFDLVFLDADKGRYDVYGRWAAAHLRVGGLLLADNAYFFGRLLEDDPDADAMRRFHREAAQAFDTVCAPTPDGLLIGLRR